MNNFIYSFFSYMTGVIITLVFLAPQPYIPAEITWKAPRAEVIEDPEHIGVASFYDYILDSGWSSKGHFVCADRDFPRYSYLKVTNLDNNKWVICKKTDHGPDKSIHPDRIIDLSSTAFSAVSDLTLGLFNAKVELCINDCAKNAEKSLMFGGANQK